MAWEEHRRRRSAHEADTAKIAGLPVVGAGSARPVAPQPDPAARAARLGQRFGWIAALAIAVAALIVAVLAFANTGTTAQVAIGRNGFGGPFARPGRGLIAPSPPPRFGFGYDIPQ